MLVHGMFNASVPKVSSTKKGKKAVAEAAVDDKLEFVVTAIHQSRGLLALDGVME